MRRLVAAELNRLRSRRFTLVALTAILLGLAAFQLAVNAAVTPPSAAEVATARTQYERDLREYQTHQEENEQSRQECLESGSPPEQCSFEPRLEYYVQPATPFAEIARVAVLVAVIGPGLALFLVGASFIGAEFTSGAIGNWLTFVPERSKVFAAKVIALAIGAAAVSAVAVAFTVAAAVLLVRLHGGQVSGLQGVLESAGRGVILVVVLALLGFCLALLARHTAAAIGVVLGYLMLSFVLAILFNVVPGLQRVKALLVDNNLLAFVWHGHSWVDYYFQPSGGEDMTSPEVERHLSFGASALYWAVLLLAALGAALLAFRRRDVN